MIRNATVQPVRIVFRGNGFRNTAFPNAIHVTDHFVDRNRGLIVRVKQDHMDLRGAGSKNSEDNLSFFPEASRLLVGSKFIINLIRTQGNRSESFDFKLIRCLNIDRRSLKDAGRTVDFQIQNPELRNPDLGFIQGLRGGGEENFNGSQGLYQCMDDLQ